MTHLVGIDQGTSGTTVIVVDQSLRIRSRVSKPIQTKHSKSGAVEQDPWKVLLSIVDATAEAIDSASAQTESLMAGFAHQGETVLAWDAENLEPLTPAIVWSDRRADSVVRGLVQRGVADQVASLSGMRAESYFCASKYRWLLDSFDVLSGIAEQGRLRLGTLETWLLAQLGVEQQTDGGTASRTQLVRLGESTWNVGLLDIFDLDADWLAPIVPSVGYRGDLVHSTWPFGLPLHCVVVDQPAALVGTGGIQYGDLKVTYGTGAFVVANAGRDMPAHQLDVVASVGWTDSSGPSFTLDGGVLSAGSALDWLARLGVDISPEAHERIIGRTCSSIRVLPSLHGLGAPSWDRSAHGAIEGLRADTDGADLLHGFLDSFGFRVREIIEAMVMAGVPTPSILRVDGGLTRSTYLMQSQSDILGIPIEVGATEEATALGVAMLAATSTGLWDLESVAEFVGRPTKRFVPVNPDAAGDAFALWKETFDR